MYKLYQWVAFFYIYCFFGWIWETSYVSIRKRQFVNRGFLHGPVIPIYGFGAISMLFLALPFRDNIPLAYFVGLVGATLLELFTGWAMESIFKVKYWDYSNQKFQYKGYICLSSSLFWGFLTVALVRWVHPPISELLLSLPNSTVLIVTLAVTAAFLADFAVSVKEALGMRGILIAMERMRNEMERIQQELDRQNEERREKLSKLAEEGRLKLAERAEEGRLTREELARKAEEGRRELSEHVDEMRRQAEALKNEAAARAEENRREREERLAAIRAKNEEQLTALLNARSRLKKRHPSASFGRFENMINEARKAREERRK